MVDDANLRDAVTEDHKKASEHPELPDDGVVVVDDDRANVTPVDQGCGVAEADKKL